MIAEPTREGILRWKDRLDDRDFQKLLLQFQKYVYEIFESLRKQTGLQLIRGILYRDEIKTLESLVEKIRRKREDQEDGERPYDFDDIRDFVGIKILCPYKNDTELVADYLFAQREQIRVVEENKEQGRREDPGGYRGFNFTVFPAVGAPVEWTSLFCEVQIKTIIEEAWDAKTHDLTYKRKRAIPQSLRDQFAVLSDILAAAERQGELVSRQIEELFAQVLAHRELAALVFLSMTMRPFSVLRERYSKIPVIDEPATLTGEHPPLPNETVVMLNEALRTECGAGRLDRDVCRVAAYLAIRSKSPGQAAFAIQLVSDLVIKKPESSWAEMLRASVLWALGRFERSTEVAERAHEKGCKEFPAGSSDACKLSSEFCFYVADAKVFHTFIPKATEEKAWALSEAMLTGPHGHEPDILDTVGLVHIALSKDNAGVEKGMELVKRAAETGKGSSDPSTKKMAEAFCSRHLYLGQMRLQGQLRWWG